MRLAVVLLGVLLVGCVQVEVVSDHSRAGTAHQDVARVTSSQQEGSVAADVPISLVPK